MWHVSVSVWSRRGELVEAPAVAEVAAVRALKGVGGGREWWWWSPTRIGHLRVGLTPAEHAVVPVGMAVHDAGESGPERART